MAIAVLDEVMLREPRLLVPGMQPLGPVRIDSSHPLSRGFIDGMVAGKRLINNQRVIVNAPFVTNVSGRYIKLSGSSSYIQLPAVPINTPKLSFMFCVAIPSQNGEMIFELSANADSNQGFYIYGLSASTIRIESNGASTLAFRDISFVFSATMTWYTVTIDVSASPHKYNLYRSGVLVYTSDLETSTPGTFSPQTLNVGSRNGSSLFSDGTFGDMFIYNRLLSSVEVMELHANPYQFLIPA